MVIAPTIMNVIADKSRFLRIMRIIPERIIKIPMIMLPVAVFSIETGIPIFANKVNNPHISTHKAIPKKPAAIA